MLDITFYVVIAFLVWAVLGIRQISRKPRARKDKTSNDLILEYNTTARVTTIVIAIAAVGSSLFLLSIAGSVNKGEIGWFILLIALILVVLASLLVVICLENSAFYRITKDGIKRHWPFLKDRFIGWEDIDSISISPVVQSLIINYSGGKFHLSTGLNGLQDFANAVKNNLPFEKWQQAEKYLNRLLS
ncbi:MAG: hypothetical protein QME41_08620 [Actinomycetota bacterium]|nr:hypothetical protein [Actinomycetota bacterium]